MATGASGPISLRGGTGDKPPGDASWQTSLSAPAEARLAWFVREAWPSPATGTALTEGSLGADQALEVTAESDRLVLFGDGIEADTVPLTWGQTACIRLAARSLRLLR